MTRRSAPLVVVLAAFACVGGECDGSRKTGEQVYQGKDGQVTVAPVYRAPNGQFAPRPAWDAPKHYRSYGDYQAQQTSDKIEEALIRIALELAQPLIEEAARQFGEWLNSSPSNAQPRLSYPVITSVNAGSLAAGAGIQPNDILVEYNGVPMYKETQTNDELRRAIAGAVGKRVEVKLIRDGKYVTVTVPGGQLMGIQYRVYQ